MPDPLLCDFPLKLRRRFYPLGFALDLETNCEAVLSAADESWADFEEQYSAAPVSLRVGVRESERGSRPQDAPVFRSSQHLLSILSDSDHFAICDLRQGFAFAWVTPQCVEDTGYFRYCFLEAMAYSMITAAGLAPVHAACVEWRGHGFLLTGPSGAGKSSLAYACLRAGFTYVSDDASYVLRSGDANDRHRISGNPYLIRLRDSAVSLFPELAGVPVSFRPGGKPTLEIRTKDRPEVQLRLSTSVRWILSLEREAGAEPELLPVCRQDLLASWDETNCYGHYAMREEIRTVLAGLMDVDVFRMRYSDLDSAVAFLKEMVP